MRNERKVGGFTLIELMIAVAIIGILVMVAIPSYTEHLKRGKRSSAASFMQTLANKQEQQLLNTRCYFSGTSSSSGSFTSSDASCVAPSGITVPSEVASNYTITVTGSYTAGTVPSYSITGVPTSSMNDTKCGTLSLTNTGTKGATGTSGATYCWK